MAEPAMICLLAFSNPNTGCCAVNLYIYFPVHWLLANTVNVQDKLLNHITDAKRRFHGFIKEC